MAIEDISRTPTKAMRRAARRGLALRAKQSPSRRGGTAVGLARARDIAASKQLSWSTIARMHSFFARHAVDKKSKGFRSGEKGYPSKGLQAWLLWGGNPGQVWAASRLRARERERGA